MDSCHIVLADENDADIGGVGTWLSKKGSLGARGRLVCVVEDIGGGLVGFDLTKRSDGRGVDCDRECIGVRGANGEYGAGLFRDRFDEETSSKPRT